MSEHGRRRGTVPNGPSPRPNTSMGQKVALIGLGVAILALCVALIEGALAVLGWGDVVPNEDPYVGFVPGIDLFERVGDQYQTREAKLAFFNEQAFQARKPRDGFRVFAVGGSTVAGRPYDAGLAFPAWLERYLKIREPDRAWEVVNAGAISYASYRIAVLMDELARHEPDLFVVYTGHNEFLEERTYTDVARPSAWQVAAERRLGRLRGWRLARHGIDQWRGGSTEVAVPTSLADEVTTKLAGWAGLDRYRRDPALEASVVAHFDFNLRRIVATARRAGAEVVFVTPVANLADFSPFKSEHRTGMDPATVARFDTLIADGEALLARGGLEPARARFEAALEIDSSWAHGHYLLGQSLLVSKRYEEAERSLVAAKDLDVAPLRALESIQAGVVTVARDLGVPLLDLREALRAENRQLLGHPILGATHLLDHVHPDTPVHQRLAAMLADWLADRGVVVAETDNARARRRTVDADVMASLDPRYYARRDLNLGKVLGWAGKLAEAEAPLRRAATVLKQDPEVQLNLGILLLKTDRLVEAEAALADAARLDPSRPEAWFNLGVARGRQGDLDGGIEALRRAIDLQPEYAEAHHDLGALLYRSDAIEAALGAFEQALALDPNAAPALRGAGLAHRRLNRLEAARAAFERALTIEPGSADAHYNLGVIAGTEGDRAAAETAYRRAIEFDPEHAAARTNLGILLAAAGQLDAARAQLEAAVAARPNAADAYLNLGVVRDQSGDAEGAIVAIERAVELAPENGRARLALAMLLMARGDTDAARAHAQAVVALGQPLPPALRDLLDR